MAKTGNYPFCTINANLAKVRVYDQRLRDLAAFSGAPKIVDAEIDLADVAGLIQGASKGEGMGNKFLSDIRPCTIILHMVRCFEALNDGFLTPTPLDDIDVINTELALADMDAVEKRINKVKKAGNKKGSDAELEMSLLTKLLPFLEEGKPAREFLDHKNITEKVKPDSGKHQQELDIVKELNLISSKPMLFVLNVDDQAMLNGNRFSSMVEEKYGVHSTHKVCSVIEEQTAQFDRPERLSFLEEYGVKEPCVEGLLRKSFDMLDLQAFFTVGPKMVHSWPIRKGTTAPKAAGEIHTDFEKKFIEADVSSWEKFIADGGEGKELARAEKKMTRVSDDYAMKDGEVFIVHHRAK